MRVHLDTDFGGDTDDACALALLLGWPDVELTGITTTLDLDGGRAGCVARYLELAGDEIPVVAGAAETLTGRRFESTWRNDRHWPDPVEPSPAPPHASLELLRASIAQGATVVAIGPLTNLARLELEQPGTLRGVGVTAMGGWIEPPRAGFPQWGPEMDFNIQCDTRAAEIVLAAAANLALAPLPVAMGAHLRGRDLPRLRAAGPVGELLARQSECHAVDMAIRTLAEVHPGLPDDLVNFHWDPLTCAAAVGWPGVQIEEMRLAPVLQGNVLAFRRDAAGAPCRVVVDVDAEQFTEAWLTSVEAIAEP